MQADKATMDTLSMLVEMMAMRAAHVGTVSKMLVVPMAVHCHLLKEDQVAMNVAFTAISAPQNALNNSSLHKRFGRPLASTLTFTIPFL